MSKIVKWGHWVVPATLGVWGLRELYLARTESGAFGYHFAGALIFFAPALGVFFWKRVGLGAAIGVCAFNIAQSLQGPFDPASQAARLMMALTLCLSFVWLVLPGVRRQFYSGNHTP